MKPASNTTVQPTLLRSAAAARTHWPVLAALAILLGLLCARVWALGVTHTDDAMWVLRSYDSFFKASDDWAHWQGRLWAYVSGSLIMFALVWQGTLFGELLRLGGFVLYFAAFHLVVAAYCGRRLALLGATLFLAFFALKWDGSILTTYPLITWPAGIACACALLAGRAYMLGGPRWQLAAAGVLLLCALFNNEGVTVTFILLAMLSVAANAAQAGAAGRPPDRRGRHLLQAFLVAATLYSLLYVGWRLMYPSIYGGNTVAPFDARRFFITLYHFSTSGSALHELSRPLSLWYADSFGGGARMDYALGQYWQGLAAAPLALLAGLLSAGLLWRQLRLAAALTIHATQRRRALAGGLMVALAPIVPVALAGTYQVWAVDMGVRAYSHTLFAYFGWSLALAALLATLAARFGQRRYFGALLLALALASGVLAALTYRANDAIARDMRPEAGRWEIVNRAVAANRALFQSGVVWIPGLAQRSQYGSLYPHYWEDYVAKRFGQHTEVAVRIPDLNDQLRGVVMLDYGYDARARRLVAVMMRYRKESLDGGYLGGRIAVDLAGAGPAQAAAYLLAYGSGGAAQRVAVASLAAAPGQPGLYLFDPPAGTDPASVRLLRADAAAGEGALAAIRLPQGLRIDFREPRAGAAALDPASLLDDSWYPIEGPSVWSGGGELHVRIPRHLVPAGPLHADIDVASYTSLGYAPGLQQMSASVNGKPMGKWDYTPGQNPTVTFELPAGLGGSAPLDLRFDVAPGMNQTGPGIAHTGPRGVGLQLRAVMLVPPPPGQN